jgi:hypothetical protein
MSDADGRRWIDRGIDANGAQWSICVHGANVEFLTNSVRLVFGAPERDQLVRAYTEAERQAEAAGIPVVRNFAVADGEAAG